MIPTSNLLDALFSLTEWGLAKEGSQESRVAKEMLMGRLSKIGERERAISSDFLNKAKKIALEPVN